MKFKKAEAYVSQIRNFKRTDSHWLKNFTGMFQSLMEKLTTQAQWYSDNKYNRHLPCSDGNSELAFTSAVKEEKNSKESQLFK